MTTRNALSRASIVTLLALAGCSPTLQDGRFSCATGVACPTGFVCRASDSLCYRSADGGAPTDAPTGPDTGATP